MRFTPLSGLLKEIEFGKFKAYVNQAIIVLGVGSLPHLLLNFLD